MNVYIVLVHSVNFMFSKLYMISFMDDMYSNVNL